MEIMKQAIENTQNEVKIPNSGYAGFTTENLQSLEVLLVNEVLLLKEVAACLSHFLASHNSMLFPETALQAKAQRDVVNANLKEVLTELLEVRQMIRPIEVKTTKVIDLVHNDDEKRAIQLFNTDRRFTINE